MRVLAWVPQPVDLSPGQRYRLEQWDPYLRQEGIEITYAPFSPTRLTTLMQRPGQVSQKAWGLLRALTRRLSDVNHASAFDLVYIFREAALFGPAIIERVLSWKGVPFIFDFDDAIWVRYVSPANSYFSYLRFPGKTATLCRLARRVIVGNRYLGEYAGRYNRHVDIVPSTIDTIKYRPLPPRAAGRPVIGWTGSYSTIQYLGMLKPVFERLRTRHDFRVVVVGGEGFAAESVEVEHRRWCSATEVEDLSDFTIGVMPLPDSEWERGKCGLKALQYMALGIPAVISPVGVNRQIVEYGRNGLLATTSEEWFGCLERLLTDPDLRRRLGEAGRASVEEHFSARVHAPRVAQLFREAAA